MLRFLHTNAMQVAAFVQATIGTCLGFTHLSGQQAAALSSYPTALGTFLAGMVINATKNGNGNGHAAAAQTSPQIEGGPPVQK